MRACTIVLGDALEVLEATATESVDLVLTDPAYESLEKHRSKGTTTRLAKSAASSNEWFEIFPNERLEPLIRGMFRVLRPARHAYVICDEETADIVKVLATEAGFYVWKSLIWVKVKDTPKRGVAALPDDMLDPLARESDVAIGMGYHYRNSTERIVFLEKRTGARSTTRPLFAGQMVQAGRFAPKSDPIGTGRQLRDLGMPDVLFDPRVRGAYPTEKPVSLLKKLVNQSTEPGEVVMDMFGGSGSTGVAALELGRRVLLSDVSPASIAAMTARLSPWATRETG